MSTKMNPEVKELWTAALRSGEYAQTIGHLQDGDGYCCLGVLCEVAIKAGVPLAVAVDGRGVTYYDGRHTRLPKAVQEWAGLPVNVELPNHDNVIKLNDDSRSFKYIAYRIDRGL